MVENELEDEATTVCWEEAAASRSTALLGCLMAAWSGWSVAGVAVLALAKDCIPSHKDHGFDLKYRYVVDG